MNNQHVKKRVLMMDSNSKVYFGKSDCFENIEVIRWWYLGWRRVIAYMKWACKVQSELMLVWTCQLLTSLSNVWLYGIAVIGLLYAQFKNFYKISNVTSKLAICSKSLLSVHTNKQTKLIMTSDLFKKLTIIIKKKKNSDSSIFRSRVCAHKPKTRHPICSQNWN